MNFVLRRMYMSTVSEQVSELGLELLLRALGEFSRVVYHGTSLVSGVAGETIGAAGKGAGALSKALLIKVIEEVKSSGNDFDRKTRKALDKLNDEAIKGESLPRQMTLLSKDLADFEKWLKKQDVLYVAATAKNQKVDDSENKSVIWFLEKDERKINMASAILLHKQGILNELSAEPYLLLHEKEKLSVVDGLDVYEVAVFRELASDFGLKFSVLGKTEESDVEQYKIICEKADDIKLASVMQQVSWSMAGEYENGIKEKVKERLNVQEELKGLILSGVPKGYKIIKDKDGNSRRVSNAKYIVNSKLQSEYVKITDIGFVYSKYGKDIEIVSKEDPEYIQKLEGILTGFIDLVIIDSEEWEKEGLSKSNLRKEKIKEKLSAFPENYKLKDENEKMRRVQKLRKEASKPLQESSWVFDRYDTEQAFSEVYQINYNDFTEPPEENITSYFIDVLEQSKKYKNYDVENNENNLDDMIKKACEKAAEIKNQEKPFEKGEPKQSL